jgi:hypothetical protein
MLFSPEGGLPKDASLLPDRHRFEPPSASSEQVVSDELQ